MRIISKFHDYYDSVQSVGYDPHLIYHRVHRDLRIMPDRSHYYGRNDAAAFVMPEELPLFSNSFLMHINPRRGLRDNKFMTTDGYLYLIGFCGKYYLTLKEFHGSGWGAKATIDYLYDKESAVKYFAEVHKTEVSRGVFDVLGECSVTPFADPLEPFRLLNCPAFAIKLRDKYSMYGREKELTVNPELATLQFYKMFDPFTAYQEIAMFLSGVLGWPENATVQVSDKDMRDAKGFDDWSFKTLPTKR